MKDFKMTKKQAEKMKQLQELVNAHRSAMSYHAGEANRISSTMRNTAAELFPELDGDKYLYTMKSDEGEIVCMGIK